MGVKPPPKIEKELDRVPGSPKPYGLGWYIEKTLANVVIAILNHIYTPLITFVRDVVIYPFDALADSFVGPFDDIIEELETNEATPPMVKDLIHRATHSEPLTLGVLVAAVVVATIVGLAMALVSGTIQVLSLEANKLSKHMRFPPGDLVRLYFRDKIGPQRLYDEALEQGWDTERADEMLELMKPLLSPADIMNLLHRGKISDEVATAQLKAHGFAGDERRQLAELSHIMPSPPDLIRMAVREAFTDDAIEEFGLHQELPPDFVSWIDKLGDKEEWAKHYWAAHWQLPSLTMGFEMLHRGIIKERHMKLLIKMHDLSPYWREHLIKLSYRPYTRVDVRRMHALGTLDDTDLLKAYKDLGYDDEKAGNMAAFTVAYNNQHERDLTKTEILDGYTMGYFNPTEAKELLQLMGYSTDEADFYIIRIAYKQTKKHLDERLKVIEKLYTNWTINSADVTRMLTELGVGSGQINEYLRLWDITRDSRTRQPTIKDLLAFWENGIIDEETARAELAAAKLPLKYINWYLVLYMPPVEA